jgi:hypothetical protein
VARSRSQGDLFGIEQADASGEDFETPEYHADPDKVREELKRILAEARLRGRLFPQRAGTKVFGRED